MKITQKQTREVEVTVGYQCDVCKKQYTDIWETQEFIHLHDVGGYGSAVGDGTEYKIDLCQHCFKEKLGQFLITKELW